MPAPWGAPSTERFQQFGGCIPFDAANFEVIIVGPDRQREVKRQSQHINVVGVSSTDSPASVGDELHGASGATRRSLSTLRPRKRRGFSTLGRRRGSANTSRRDEAAVVRRDLFAAASRRTSGRRRHPIPSRKPDVLGRIFPAGDHSRREGRGKPQALLLTVECHWMYRFVGPTTTR